MENNIASDIDVRLYLSGLEVPIQSINLSAAVNGHMTAVLNIPPAVGVTKIKPRTVVHVFTRVGAEKEKLLFEGEVIGNQHIESTMNRSVVLSCVDLTNYWEYIYQYFLNKLTPAALGELETVVFTSGSGSSGDNPISAFQVSLPESQASDPVTASFLKSGGNVQKALINVVGLMANLTNNRNGDITSPRINTFIESAFVFLRFLERSFILRDDQIQSFIRAKTFEHLLVKQMRRLGDFASLMQLLRAMLDFLNYNLVVMPAPSYTRRTQSSPDGNDLDFFFPIIQGQSEEEQKVFRNTISNLPDGSTLDRDNTKFVRSWVFKPKTYFLPAPTCNLIFPHMYDSFHSSRPMLQEPTRLRLRTHPIVNSSNQYNAFNTLSYYAPPELKAALELEKATTPDPVIAGGGAAGSVDKLKNTQDSGIKRYETLIPSTGAELTENSLRGINEYVTGVLPVFEELGFAEYAAVAAGADRTDLLNPAEVGEVGSVGALVRDTSSEEGRKNVENIYLGNEEVTSDKLAKLHTHMAQAAEYKLDYIRAASRAINGIKGPYNPNLALGFPALLFTRTVIYAGEIASLSHTLNCMGSAETVFDLTPVREIEIIPGIYDLQPIERQYLSEALYALGKSPSSPTASLKDLLKILKEVISEDEQREQIATGKKRTTNYFSRLKNQLDGYDPGDDLPNQPLFLSSQYRPENIGFEVYARLLGGNIVSSLEFPGTIFAAPETIWSQAIAANLILLAYLSRNDNGSYWDPALFRRSTATIDDIMHRFLGLPRPLSNTSKQGSVSKAFSTSLDEIEVTDVEQEWSKTSSGTTVKNKVLMSNSPFTRIHTAAVKYYLKNLKSEYGGFRG